MKSNHEKHIITSWHQNAEAWITAIQNEEIESRILITNKTIVDAVLDKQPKKVLDIGCGEGWLSRALSQEGIDVLGIDVVPALVHKAKALGGARFKVVSYEALSSGIIQEKFDAVVCNFSLFGYQSVIQLFSGFKNLVNPNGHIIIQTLHPLVTFREYDYKDGWRTGSWTGFSDKFTNPAPWYFRTLETWTNLFQQHQIELCEIIEPKHPKTQTYVSIIFVGKNIK